MFFVKSFTRAQQQKLPRRPIRIKSPNESRQCQQRTYFHKSWDMWTPFFMQAFYTRKRTAWINCSTRDFKVFAICWQVGVVPKEYCTEGVPRFGHRVFTLKQTKNLVFAIVFDSPWLCQYVFTTIVLGKNCSIEVQTRSQRLLLRSTNLLTLKVCVCGNNRRQPNPNAPATATETVQIQIFLQGTSLLRQQDQHLTPE